jgi:hypothetical protein
VVDGDIAIVGAQNHVVVRLPSADAVYVLMRSGDWMPQAKL